MRKCRKHNRMENQATKLGPVRVGCTRERVFFEMQESFIQFGQSPERTKVRLFSFLILISILAFPSCREKAPVDNTYYQPYRKSTPVQTLDTIKDQGTLDGDSLSLETTEALPEDRGVDLLDHYFIVLATYSIQDLANSRKAEMVRLGYKADVFMQNDDGWYKLAIESYSKKETAQKALTRLKQLGSPFDEARIVYNP